MSTTYATDAEVKRVARRWLDLYFATSSLVQRALIARNRDHKHRYLLEASETQSRMQSLEQTLKWHIEHQPDKRFVVAGGLVLNIHERGELGIEGVNKPEALEDIEQWM